MHAKGDSPTDVTNKDRILAVLARGRRLCDDCMSDAAEVRPRQQVYVACTALHGSGLISRMPEPCESCGRVKITSAQLPISGPVSAALALPTKPTLPASAMAVVPSVSVPAVKPTAAASRAPQLEGTPWYWEGNVQARIVDFLRSAGAGIVSEANTATRQQGKDIVAFDADGLPLWLTVKGWPAGSPNTQARHWFAGALLDLALYRTQDAAPRLAMGLPRGFTTYEGLVKRTADTLHFLGCVVFWVTEAGIVVREEPKAKAPQWSD